MRLGADAASLGALLALVAGVGRTALAMGRNGDLPKWLAAVHPQGDEHRRYPRALQVAGSTGCVLLGLTVPLEALPTGLLVLAAGVLYRVLRR